jgi:hypothetical protein
MNIKLMNIKGKSVQGGLVLLLALILAVPLSAHDKKKGAERGVLEKMEAVPCGAKQTGLAGLGTLWASAGITHVNSNEKLCPQYLLRTDDMEYQIRPRDLKHPRILPVGQEGEFKINKDVMQMRIPEGDRKTRSYQVVAMKPIDHSASPAVGSNQKYDTPQTGQYERPLPNPVPAIRPN